MFSLILLLIFIFSLFICRSEKYQSGGKLKKKETAVAAAVANEEALAAKESAALKRAKDKLPTCKNKKGTISIECSVLVLCPLPTFYLLPLDLQEKRKKKAEEEKRRRIRQWRSQRPARRRTGGGRWRGGVGRSEDDQGEGSSGDGRRQVNMKTKMLCDNYAMFCALTPQRTLIERPMTTTPRCPPRPPAVFRGDGPSSWACPPPNRGGGRSASS